LRIESIAYQLETDYGRREQTHAGERINYLTIRECSPSLPALKSFEYRVVHARRGQFRAIAARLSESMAHFYTLIRQ